MSHEGETSEKSTTTEIGAHGSARALVRLIQCPQCSRPLRSPVTLPCGNSLCRECLPQPYQRENISYPDLPGRRERIRCPFVACGDEHPALDCSIDVTLAKVMESVAEVMTKHLSLVESTRTLMEEFRQQRDIVETEMDTAMDTTQDMTTDTSTDNISITEVASAVPLPPDTASEIISEKPTVHELPGDRLIATYTLAAQGDLGYNTELSYDGSASDDDHLGDIAVMRDILESTQNQVDCQVCYSLMLDPVTTYCGHTLCRKCMARVLDHSLFCPVCRRGLAIPPILARHPSNKTISDLLNGLCPDLVAARAEAVAAEEMGTHADEPHVPLFVCTLGFPNQPTLLRIFEPRYRLMLRRCLEGNREFGMLMYNRYHEPQGDLGPIHFYHYGTMLHVVHSQLLPDGTSLVETRGMYRFRVKSHGVLDGYITGTVERIEDVSLAEEEAIEAEETALQPAEEGDVPGQIDRLPTQVLLRTCHDFVTRMRGRSARWLAQRVLNVHGEPPEDPALFPYWFASVLPISDEEKYKLMGTRTVRARLKVVVQWIRRIESQRWYQSSSCRVL